MKSLPKLYEEGKSVSDLSKQFFVEKFIVAKEIMIKEDIELTSVCLGSGEQAQNLLAEVFKKAVMWFGNRLWVCDGKVVFFAF